MSKQKKLSKKEEEELELKKLKLKEEQININKKYGIKKIIDNFYLIFTEYYINELWENKDPINFILEFLKYQFEKLKIMEDFKDKELKGYSYYIVNSIVELKNKYDFKDNKFLILVNLNFYLFIFNDNRFEVDFPIINNDFEDIIIENKENCENNKKEELEDKFILDYGSYEKGQKLKQKIKMRKY